LREGFRELITWEKAYKLALELYAVTRKFPKEEQYCLTSQIRRAAISVPANIAEGYERHYRKEYVQFLMVAKGSLGELEVHLLLSKDLGYVSLDEYSNIDKSRVEVVKILRGLIKSLRPL
jgi:four helix bundle protein